MRKPLVAGFLALVLAPMARAQEVTEADFLAAFGEEHAAVRALTEDVGRAEATLKSAGLLANPRLEYWREAPESTRLTNLTLSWTPPLDGRYGLGKKAAQAGLAAARERFNLDRAALRRKVREAFAEWSLAFERRELLKRQLDLVARLAGHEHQRARVGEASGLAARRFRLAEGEVRVALATADAGYAMAEALARAWRTDLPAGAGPARATLTEPPPGLDIGGSPELAALEAETEQARFAERRAGRFWRFPALQFGWQTLEEGGIQESGPILATSWTVPLFDRDQAARLETGRRKEVAAAQLHLAKARVAGEVEGGLAAYRALFASARDAHEIAAEVDPVIEAATRAFRAGEAGLTDLLESLRSAFAAGLREIDARGQALEAHRDLEAIVGRSLFEGGSR